jgi:hypothetical protein
MTNSIKIYTTDFHVYQPEQLMSFLYQSYIDDVDITVDIIFEGPCCETIGLYKLLDGFCESTNYAKSRITIITANLIESHAQYKIIPKSHYWYEINEIQTWLKNNQYCHEFLPDKHFGNFIGRSTWYRIWIASQLYHQHREKTLQTFHSFFACQYVTPSDDGVPDTLELEYLNYFRCDNISQAIEFLNICPLIISPQDIVKAQQVNGYIPSTNNQCYPLQHPANLMLEDYYRKIFVDVVCETKVMGNSLFLSEKTWRPMVAKRPFITMSNLNTLKNLRRLGFKTFDQWWDEGYDDYSDQDRVREILKLVNTISTWSIDHCRQVLIEMQDVLDHNYQVFCELSYKKINLQLGL